jgi:hypothetical protein
MARFRGRCALNLAPGVGSIRSDSSAMRSSGSLLDDSGMTALTNGVPVGDITLFGNALPLHTPSAFEEFRRV